ncbi:MAG: sigma-70 family RNA polymerase sigma factor [Bacteroidetes bacterium]|nr:sigma-70 family RNA polymerase sigma factor [Bacteroidota bacterium]
MEQSGKTISDDALQKEWLEIQAAQADRSAFRPLYDRYFEPLYRYIYRRTGDKTLADDLCSQVFLKAMQRLDKYVFKGVPFSAWLYRIAGNEVAQHFRNTSKNRVVTLEDDALIHMTEETDTEDLGLLRDALIDSLDQIREQDLEIIELRYFEKRPFKEIATILDITESNAKIRTYRVLERIKKRILQKRKPGV